MFLKEVQRDTKMCSNKIETLSPSPKVSGIVAAYNAESFIRRCLDSLLAQTMKDCEVIVVDDGSTDGTAEIVDSYVAKDGRVRVIHKENGGVASARQAGLDAAQGEYTIHADADDWVDAEMLSALCRKAEEVGADMVICDYFAILPWGQVQYCKQRPSNMNHLSIMGQMMGGLYGSLWNKLIRRDCYERFHICFREDVKVCEDQLVVMSILAHPVHVSYVNEAFYHYDRTQNANSFVNRETPISQRLLPLEIIQSSVDITPVQHSFDNAVFRIAYYALSIGKEYCPDYSALFSKHKASIQKADAPRFAKICVLLRLKGIRLPLASLKRFFYSVKKFFGR